MSKKWRILVVASLVVLCVCLVFAYMCFWWSPFDTNQPSRAEMEAKRPEVKAILEADKRRASTEGESPKEAVGRLYEQRVRAIEGDIPKAVDKQQASAWQKAVLDMKKEQASILQSNVMPFYWLPYEGHHYPDLPNELLFINLKRRIALRKEAAGKHEIRKWAAGYDNGVEGYVLTLRSSKVKKCFLVMGSGDTSCFHSWIAYLYGCHPDKDGDPKPWKLLYVGGAGLHGMQPDAIGHVYIDDELGCLVFADRRTGKVNCAIPIAHEIELMQKR